MLYAEVAVRDGAELGDVEAFDFRVRADAVADRHLHSLEQHERQPPGEGRHDNQANCLPGKLRGAYVEKPRDASCRAVPAVAELTIREKAGRQQSPGAAGAVYGNRAGWVIETQTALDEQDRAHDKGTGDRAR